MNGVGSRLVAMLTVDLWAYFGRELDVHESEYKFVSLMEVLGKADISPLAVGLDQNQTLNLVFQRGSTLEDVRKALISAWDETKRDEVRFREWLKVAYPDDDTARSQDLPDKGFQSDFDEGGPKSD